MSGTRVSVEVYVAITDFLKANKEKIETERLTQAEVVDLVSQAMSRKLGLSTVKRCCTIVGIKWTHISHIQQPPVLDREAIILMLVAIEELYIRIAGEPPQRFADMKTRYVQEVTTPRKEKPE